MKKQAAFALFAAVLLITALVFTAQANTDEIAYRNTISNMKLDFSNGNNPTCPFCGTTPDRWIALDTDVTVASYLNGHYYLAGNRNHTQVGRYSVNSGESACLYLNGYDITSSGYPVFEVEGTLTVMGKGNLTGNYYHDALGSAVDLLAGTLNLCGGTFQKADTQITPVIGMRAAGGKLNMYDGTVIAASNVGSGNGAGVKLSAAATFNMYGGMISGGAATLGGNVSVHVADAAFYMSGGTISGGRATEMGGNIFVENGTVSVSGSAVVDGGQAPAGGNIAVVGAAALNIESGAVVSNGVSWYDGVVAFGGGGNIFAKDTNVTISGTISDGRANLTGGNIEFRSGILNLISGAAISGGQATYDGGNICTTGIYMNDCTISGGKADRNGDSVYVSSYAVVDQNAQVNNVFLENSNQNKATLRVEAAFEGNVGVYNLQLPNPVYGSLLNATYYTCKGPFPGTVWLGDISDKPWLCSEGTQLRVASVSTFKDGQKRWYADNAQAVENYGDADYLLPVGDVELKGGNYVIDLNGQELNITGTGNVTCFDSSNDTYKTFGQATVNGPVVKNKFSDTVMGKRYIKMEENGVYSFHRMELRLTGVSMRPATGGIYYTGRWECDDAVKNVIKSFGVAVSLKDMPGTDLRTDSDSMYTAFGKEDFESGVKKTGVIIEGIVKDTAMGATQDRIDKNARYAKRSVYAKAYIVLDDGTEEGQILISDDNIGYSLHSTLRLAEKNISSMANKSQDLKDFCAYWANYGLTGSDWEFDFDTLEVGFAREDITPDYQVILVGGSQRVTSEALDEITLTCVALNEGDETYLIYTADLLLADDSRYVAAAKRAVEAATGVPRANIIINTTHTHSSVGIGIDSWTYTDENGAVVDITENLYRFREDFYAAATTAAQKAIADLTTVTAAYAGSVADDRTKHDGIAFVRHYIKTDGNPDYSNNGGYDSADDMFEAWYSCKYKNHAAFADEEIQLAKFERADGKKNVVLISVPVHGTLNENSKKISADFPYYIRQTVEAEGESLLAYFIGAAGDQVPRSKLCSYHLDGVPNNTDYEVYGKKLGNLALGVLDNLTQLESTALKATKAVYEGEVNDYRFDYINSDPDFFNKTSEQLLAETKYKFNDAYDIAYTKHRYEYVQKHGLGMDMNIQTMAIGELGFVFAPYEMSGVNGMWIKDNSPYKNTFMVTCSDDTVSYVASQIAFDNWSYEASCTWFKPGAGEGLAEKFVETLGQQINS